MTALHRVRTPIGPFNAPRVDPGVRWRQPPASLVAALVGRVRVCCAADSRRHMNPHPTWHLVAPDMFTHHGGIARIARAFAAAMSRHALERGRTVEIHTLHDRPGDEASGYFDATARVHAYNSHRLHFAAAVMSAVRSASAELVVYCHLNFAPLSAATSTPYVVLCHGIEAWDRLAHHRRAALRGANRVLAVSNFTGRMVAGVQGVDRRRIRTLWNCLDPLWANSIEDRKAPVAGPYVLLVSRLGAAEEQKGVGHAVLGFAEAVRRQHLAPDWRLVIVGDGPARPATEALARDAGLGDRAIFLGSVDDGILRAMYRECEVFLLPSGKEGFGLVFLEAMAYAKPVIAAAAAAAPEVVADSKSGILVPYGDPDAIGHAIVRLARHPEARAELGREGRRRLEMYFTYSRYAERVAMEIDSTLDTGAGDVRDPR